MTESPLHLTLDTLAVEPDFVTYLKSLGVLSVHTSGLGLSLSEVLGASEALGASVDGFLSSEGFLSSVGFLSSEDFLSSEALGASVVGFLSSECFLSSEALGASVDGFLSSVAFLSSVGLGASLLGQQFCEATFLAPSGQHSPPFLLSWLSFGESAALGGLGGSFLSFLWHSEHFLQSGPQWHLPSEEV